MAIAFVAAGTKAEGNSATVTPALPAGAATNDVLICVLAHVGTAATWPGGWTEFITYHHSTANAQIQVAYARHGASAPVITGPGGSTVTFVSAFSGCITTGSPVDQTATDESGSLSPVTFPAITPTYSNTMLLMTCAYEDDVTFDDLSGSNPVPSIFAQELTTLGTADQATLLAGGLKTNTTTSSARTSAITGRTDVWASATFNLRPRDDTTQSAMIV